MAVSFEHHSSAVLTREEMLRFLDFLDEIANEAECGLPLKTPDPYQKIMIYLMRRHLEARMTTVTTLAFASGVPYATAMRRIGDMIDEGLIIQRPRTKTGKSFSLHPSPHLIEAWYDYVRRMKRLVGRTMGFVSNDNSDDYYFGGSYLSARIIPLPSVLQEPLKVKPPLNILVHADPTFMAMDSLKKQFEQILGLPIRNRALSIDRLRLEALANAGRDQSLYDVIAVDLPWIGEFADKKVLAPLNNVVSSERISASDFHPAGWKGCFYKGQQWGVPIQTTPELFFYRTDLFEEAGLAPPTTAAGVLDAARVLHKPAQGRRGIAWNAARGTALGHTFLMIMAAFGQCVLNLRSIPDGYDASELEGERLRPMINSEGGQQTAEYLKELLDYSPLNILSMSWYERIVSYGSGEVAMAYGYSLLAPYFEFDKNSPACGKTGFLPHPSGPKGRNIAPVGGYALGIPANIAPERREAVQKSLKLLTSAEACKLYMLNGSLVSPRFSVSADPEVRKLSPIVESVDTMARNGQLHFWPRPPASEITSVISICGEELHDMLRGLTTVEQALTNAQNRSDALMRAAGHY
jgi:multiple sugar transport system substrate-binding protein